MLGCENASQKSQPDKTVKNECPYNDCLLPENQNQCWWQIAYLFCSVLVLSNDHLLFTPLSIFLYCAPVFIDALYFKAKGLFLIAVRILLIFASGFIIVSCFLCVNQVIVINSETFSVNKDNMILNAFSNHPIHKDFIAKILFVMAGSPLMIHVGTPTKYVHKISSISKLLKSA